MQDVEKRLFRDKLIRENLSNGHSTKIYTLEMYRYTVDHFYACINRYIKYTVILFTIIAIK